MPILKIPVTHKFGIISHSQRLELQERLLKEAFDNVASDSQRDRKVAGNPYEVSDEFIKKYNSALNTVNQSTYEEMAEKILFRIKRRVGLASSSSSNYVNIPFGWTELTLLAQCKGSTYQKCLDVLLISLNQAPVSKSQLASLFYLAETVLYWLQTENIDANSHTTSYKILKIGELVFLRLYHHNMSGDLHDEDEAKSRLLVYLEGLREYESIFVDISDMLLAFRYIDTMGKILTNDFKQASITPPNNNEGPAQSQNDHIDLENDATQTHSTFAGKVSIASEVHQLSPSLFHALDVWRCTCGASGGLKAALEGLWKCCEDIRQESWIDVYASFLILTEASKSNLLCLQLFQLILEDILDNWEPEAETKKDNSKGNTDLISNEIAVDNITSKDDLTSTADTSTNQQSAEYLHQFTAHMTPILETNTNSRARESAITIPIEDNATRWTWHIGVACVDLLGHVALHGATSMIRQTALCAETTSSLHRLVKFQHHNKDEQWSWRIRYAALRALVQVSEGAVGDPVKEASRNATLDAIKLAKQRENSPRVMKALQIGQIYGSLEQQLKVFHKDKIPLFLSTHIARSLSELYLPPLPPPLSLNATPRDSHRKSLTVRQQPISSLLTGRRAAPASLRVPSRKEKENAYKNLSNTYRVPLRQEIELAAAFDCKPPSFVERQDFTLFRVVEDQWRKDLHMQMELEEESRNNEILEKQRENVLNNLTKIQSYKTMRQEKSKQKTAEAAVNCST